MCGIAGLIHKGKTVNIGKELQDMLQALKHRGPDSTGFALYGEGNSQGDYIMRFKVGENVAEGSSAVKEDKSIYDTRRKQVDKHIRDLGGDIVKDEQLTPYSFRYVIKYDKDLMEFSKNAFKKSSYSLAVSISFGSSSNFCNSNSSSPKSKSSSNKYRLSSKRMSRCPLSSHWVVFFFWRSKDSNSRSSNSSRS